MPLWVRTAPLGVASIPHGLRSSRSRPGSIPLWTGIDAPPSEADPTRCGVVLTPSGIGAPNHEDDAGQTGDRPFSSGVDASTRPKHPSEPAIDPTQKPLDAMRAALTPQCNEYGLGSGKDRASAKKIRQPLHWIHRTHPSTPLNSIALLKAGAALPPGSLCPLKESDEALIKL